MIIGDISPISTLLILIFKFLIVAGLKIIFAEKLD
jgi:hypothetical protein